MKIYMVSLRWIETPQNNDMVDAILGQFSEWLRWNGWTWFVATYYSPADIRRKMMERLQPNDSLIVAEISQAGIDGWAPQWVWDWISVRANPGYIPQSLLPPPPPPPPPQPSPPGTFLSSLYKP